jgi:hypothetical protein
VPREWRLPRASSRESGRQLSFSVDAAGHALRAGKFLPPRWFFEATGACGTKVVPRLSLNFAITCMVP